LKGVGLGYVASAINNTIKA